MSLLQLMVPKIWINPPLQKHYHLQISISGQAKKQSISDIRESAVSFRKYRYYFLRLTLCLRYHRFNLFYSTIRCFQGATCQDSKLEPPVEPKQTWVRCWAGPMLPHSEPITFSWKKINRPAQKQTLGTTKITGVKVYWEPSTAVLGWFVRHHLPSSSVFKLLAWYECFIGFYFFQE